MKANKEKGSCGTSNLYGYARVSTKEQNEVRQIIALTKYGVESQNLFIDKVSGKDFCRPNYLALMQIIKENDVIVVKSIDRLGRKYEDILKQWQYLTKEKKVNIVVLDMPLLDTRKGRDLIGTLISDIVLQLLSYVAQTERDFIKQRQAEGIAAAKARGVRFGVKPKKKPRNYDTCLDAWREGRMSARSAAKELKVTHATFLKWARESLTEDEAQ